MGLGPRVCRGARARRLELASAFVLLSLCACKAPSFSGFGSSWGQVFFPPISYRDTSSNHPDASQSFTTSTAPPPTGYISTTYRIEVADPVIASNSLPAGYAQEHKAPEWKASISLPILARNLSNEDTAILRLDQALLRKPEGAVPVSCLSTQSSMDPRWVILGRQSVRIECHASLEHRLGADQRTHSVPLVLLLPVETPGGRKELRFSYELSAYAW